MHELSLCRSLLDIINEQMMKQPGKRVIKVTLEMGQLALIDESALRLGFEIASKGSIAEGARLELLVIEGLAVCDACHQQVKLYHYYDACQNCGHFSLTILHGEELRIQSMEVK